MKELSPVQRCRANRWKVGTFLKAVYSDPVRFSKIVFFRITAIGEEEILGKEIPQQEKTTSGEIILPLNSPLYTAWRRTSIKRASAWQKSC
jgi:hypothetical protein